MPNRPTINPDTVRQQAIQAKLNVYQAKEHFESVLKSYNDRLDDLVKVVNLMKGRILELEAERGEAEERSGGRSVPGRDAKPE